MTARKPPPMAMTAHVGADIGSRITHLTGGGSLFAPIQATFTSDELRIELTIDVEDGVPVCRRYVAERVGGGGLELMTTEVTRGVKLRALMAHACAAAALEGANGAFTTATTVEAVEAVLAPLRRKRTPVTDTQLRRFAAAYRRDFIAGRMREFAESLGYSERHTYRLKKLAIERGFLKEG
jgi:hypothetical protein